MKAEREHGPAGEAVLLSPVSVPRSPGILAGLASFARDNAALLLMIAVLVTAAQQAFFINYRTALYGVISYDDYQTYLLYLLGKPGGVFPLSPWPYRIGSVLMAAPFYELPIIPINGGRIGELAAGTLSPFYIKATQAMCFANVFYLSLSCVLTFLYGRIKLRLPDETCFIGAAVMFVLYQLIGLTSIDGIAVLPLTIVAIAVFERMRWTYAVTVVVSALINEKIVLIALLMVGLRLVFSPSDRRFYLFATGVAFASLLAYVAAVYTLHFPGNEGHRDPSTYVQTTLRMLKDTMFTPKGVYLTWWPILLLVGLWAGGIIVPRRFRLAAVSDIGVIVGLLLLAVALGVNYNVGRIVLYAGPIFVIAAMPLMASRHLAREGVR